VSQDTVRKIVTGKAVPVAGDDIDTDRIIPARFMKGITFEGLEKHVFEDARIDENGQSKNHPFDEPKYQGASVLLVNKNFGCGSSREHAPQALIRWGIKAIIGESFAEIFFGNCVTLGVPAVVVGEEVIKKLMASVGENPAQEVTIDVEKGEIRYAGGVVPCNIPAGPKKQLVEGSWDGTGLLLSNVEKVKQTAAKIPYVSGF
jgi:3-isopropylmalate/(R)-2-methylmalate dehydratase small subunit